jgi:transposase
MGWLPGRAYHQDLRERVFQVADAGTSVSGVAKVLQVSVSYVSKVLGRRRRTGETTARPQRGHVPAKLAAHHDAIRARVSAVPDATLAELRSWLRETHQIAASTTLLWETLRKLNLTLKKRPYMPRNRRDRMLPRRGPHGARSNRR